MKEDGRKGPSGQSASLPADRPTLMLSLYIHIPFCIRKCPYCGFYSVPYADAAAGLYIDALCKEVSLYAQSFLNRPFGSIYIGGGTPTVLSPAQLRRILADVRNSFAISQDAEVTVEANPCTVTAEALESLLEAGVNRLSIGVQSFSDRVLRFLGRPHSALDAEDAVVSAAKAGFGNIGADLIYGIPGQGENEWKDSLERCIDLGPAHVSAYCLSLDEGTYFSRLAAEGRFRLPDDECVSAQYEYAVHLLTSAGYRRYEVSNFSLPGFECRHNLNYWRRGEYLGLGASAWSFIDGQRWMNISDIDSYLRRILAGVKPVGFSERISDAQAAREYLMLWLRTSEGLDMDMFRRRHGDDAFKHIIDTIPSLVEQGIVSLGQGRLRLTDLGMLLADSVMERLFVRGGSV